MKEKKDFSLRERGKSFHYAWQGIKFLWRDEHNFRIHAAVSACVILAGWLLEISIGEWLAVVFSVGIVMTAEAFNSALEGVADFISPDYDVRIKRIKDLSAAAVLLTAIMAAVVGCFIFIPKIIALC